MIDSVERTPPHTTHPRDLPERVTITDRITRLKASLCLFSRRSHRQGHLYFVLILPDGSKSLIPAAWTDFDSTAPPWASPSRGFSGDLLHLRSLVDALLGRTVVSAPSVADQESHATTALKFLDDLPLPETCLWEQIDDERKRLVVETLARLMTKATRANAPQEQSHD